MRRAISGFFMACALFWSASATVGAESVTATGGTEGGPVAVTFVLDSTSALVGDVQLELAVPPRLYGDVTFVPVRTVSEAFGAEVSWDGERRQVGIAQGEKRLSFIVGEATAFVDGQPAPLEHPAFIELDTTLVPLRFIAEHLDYQVSFAEVTRTITISPQTAVMSHPPLPSDAEGSEAENQKDQGEQFGKTGAAEPERSGKAALLDRKRMDRAQLQVLIGSSKLQEHVMPTDTLMDVVVDNQNRIYVLYRGKQTENKMTLLRYDPATGQMETLVDGFDKRFNFKAESGAGPRELLYNELAAAALAYDKTTDRLYMLAWNTNLTSRLTGMQFYHSSISAVVFEVEPDIKMVTYARGGSHHPLPFNFLLISEDGRFYFSDIAQGRLYGAREGDTAQDFADLDKTSSGARLAALFKDERLYYYNMLSRALYEVKVDSGEAKKIAQLSDQTIQYASAKEGLFILTGGKRLSVLDATGKITLLLTLDELDQAAGFEATPVATGSGRMMWVSESVSPVIAFGQAFVDEQGDFVFWDRDSRIFRKVELFQKP